MSRIQFKNDDFSKLTEDLPELQQQTGVKSTATTFYRSYLRPLLPARLRRPPTQSGQLQVLVDNSNLLAGLAQDERDIEGIVKVNGRILPGIFQGMSMAGGAKLVPYNKQRGKKEIVVDPITGEEVVTIIPGLFVGKKFIPGAFLFSDDKGDKPVRGTASFLMSDDLFSSAREKAQEFMTIITNDDQSIVKSKEKIPRVFILETFISGADWRSHLNFTRIKVASWRVGLPVIGQEGAIPCSFDFEQYEVLITENRKEASKTPDKTGDGEQTEVSDPGLSPIEEQDFVPQ